MRIAIAKEILEKYPEVEIGYLVAEVRVTKTDPRVESLKNSLNEDLARKGINATNFVAHPSIAIWRTIYQEDFGVNPRAFRSSLESLVRRTVTGKGMGSICNIVDLYNCTSVLSLLPMGGYDLDKIIGDITIRFAKKGESFVALGDKSSVTVESNQVVYADEQNILCWLWNHKDAACTAVREDTKNVLFFIDAFDQNALLESLKMLQEHLNKIEARMITSGALNAHNPCREV